MTAASPDPGWRRVLTDPVLLPAFGFGAGLLRPAPGTWGTLAGVPIAALIGLLPTTMTWPLTLVLLGVGVPLCGAAARRLGVHDHGGIVWDEIAAFVLFTLLVPASLVAWTLAFVLFRLLDITKPWPIRLADRHVHGGVGIMLDDVLATGFGVVVFHLVWPWVPPGWR